MNSKKFIRIIIYVVIAFIVIAYGMLDYIVLRPHFGIKNDTAWIGIILTVIVVIIVMILARYLREQDKITNSKDIPKYQELLSTHSKVILNNNLNAQLDEFITKRNNDTKIKTYKERLRNKIYKCKNDEKRKKLNEELNKTDEEILQLRVKYKKITSSKLYSNVFASVNDDENDISIHKASSVLQMLICKTLPLILGAVFTGGLLIEFAVVGPSILYSTIMKIIIVVTSIISAILSADLFVDGEVTSTLRKRVNISLGFANSSPEIKRYFENDKKGTEIERNEQERLINQESE